MHVAAFDNKPEIVAALIDQHANVNARDQNGHAPLHLAVQQKAKPVIELLLAAGANVNARNNFNNTPLFCNPNKEIVDLLFAKGADLNATDTTGRTSLNCAAYQNNYPWAEALVAHGADINIVASDHTTALSWAEKRQNKPLIDLLKSHGVKPTPEPPKPVVRPAPDTPPQIHPGDPLVIALDGRKRNSTGNLELIAHVQFPESCQMVLSGKLLTAIAEDGSNLLPATESERQLVGRDVLWVHRLRSKTFDKIPIQIRPTQAARLRELSGTFTYLSGDWKEVDLGLTGFKIGNQGTGRGVRITRIEPWKLSSGSELLALTIDVPSLAHRGWIFYDEAGTVLPVREIQTNYNSTDKCEVLFLLQTGHFPAKGRVVVKIIEGQKLEGKFSANNVSLPPLSEVKPSG